MEYVNHSFNRFVVWHKVRHLDIGGWGTTACSHRITPYWNRTKEEPSGEQRCRKCWPEERREG